jgi:hypothetical protein
MDDAVNTGASGKGNGAASPPGQGGEVIEASDNDKGAISLPTEAALPKRGRGRPPGSKNKPKQAEDPTASRFADLGEHQADTEQVVHRKSVFEDLDAHKIEDEDDDEEATEKPLLSIPVKRPPKKDFIRAHPIFQFTAYVFEDDVSGETYCIDPTLRKKLREADIGMRKVVLVPYVNRRGTLFLWAITTTEKGDWHNSAMKIVHIARERWVRVGSDRDRSCYVAYVATRSYGDPEFPDRTLSEMLDIAFSGKYIDNLDHSAVKDLIGG